MGRLATPDEGQHTITVRMADVGDAADVASLLEALGYPCTRSEAADRILVATGDSRQQLLLAERDGHVRGLVSLHSLYMFANGADLARITALVVEPGEHRQGIGRRLLREAEALARRTGAARIEVTSGPQRTEARAFYCSCGYSGDSQRFVKLLGD
ncbi:GNAT family N-acetyltransferase [Lysobacter sp. A3-1-A15]|uniref:GNAT family N-acetyltransferase n=1 Tax=Novilysobacter viscosus TaxID=3098602 RepID=UPI002EDA23D1